MDRLASVLLRRTGGIYLAGGAGTPDGFVDHLEIDLAERGWLLDPTARAAVAQLEEPLRTAWAGWLLATIDADVGADRPHVPLFRRFPDSVPDNTAALYVDRMLAFLFQQPEQPCVLCGRDGTVAPVSPCGHLVCRACFDGADYSACPVCHQRIDTDDPFLTITRPRWRTPPSTPLRLRRIVGRADRVADAEALRDELVARPTPLTPADRGDLAVLIEATATPGDLSWLSADVPTRENLGAVLALAASADLAVALSQICARWSTATDIARTLWSLSGGDPGLVLPPKPTRDHHTEGRRPSHEPRVEVERARVGPFPRRLRRAALVALDGLPLRDAVEDVLRHATVWKRLGEHLHPFDGARRHPRAAVCFAVLRGSAHPVESDVGAAILAADASGAVEAVVASGMVRARARTFAARVEEYLAAGDARRAAQLLSTRPGDFLRRLDHVARLTQPDGIPDLAARAGSAAETAAPGVALSAYAALAARDEPSVALPVPVAAAAAVLHKQSSRGRLTRLRGRLARDEPGPATLASRAERLPRDQGRVPGVPRRVFFPRGNVMRAWSAIDRRPLLPPGAPDVVRAAIADALIARAATLPGFEIAVIDAALAHYPAPTRARTLAPASRTVPRGALVPLPDGDVVRLFLHWTQPEPQTRVDLDLSVLFLDAAWQYVGHCDYTNLRFRDAAVHSGDLTSAPAPSGATEFLDVRIGALAEAGVSHAVPVVFSYNDVPFERLTDAFAGFASPTDPGVLFDAARVIARFDLVGDARVLAPMVIHVRDRSFRWTDLNVSSSGYGHAIHRYGTVLGHAGEDMELAFGTNRRATLLQVAAMHAAARARRVWVRYGDGTAREVAADLTQILAVASLSTGAGNLPVLRDQRVLFVAADRLPDDASGAASGSLLVAATSGDPAANSDPLVLLSTL